MDAWWGDEGGLGRDVSRAWEAVLPLAHWGAVRILLLDHRVSVRWCAARRARAAGWGPYRVLVGFLLPCCRGDGPKRERQQCYQ